MKYLPTFSIGTLLVLTVAVALLVPSFAYPGAYAVYLPILAIFLTSVALFRSLFEFRQRRRRCIFLTILLALFVFGFASLFDLAVSQYGETAYVSEQFRRVVNLKDPNEFRLKALILHSQLIAKDAGERMIPGDSDIVPPDIQSVRPVSIFASDNYLIMKMTPSGDSRIVIYPSESSFPRVSAFRVANDFYYWGRQQ